MSSESTSTPVLTEWSESKSTRYPPPEAVELLALELLDPSMAPWISGKSSSEQ